MEDKYYVTKERLEELKKEVEELKTTKRLEVAERLKRAKEFGDLSENSEYNEAREEQSRVETRIFELDELLKRAVIIKKASGADTVQVGSTVTAKSNGKAITYTIVGSEEADISKGKVSNKSPFGHSILGKKKGEVFSFNTPQGQVKYKVVNIR